MTTTKTVALVTGANKGIGFEIARQLGRRGLTVVVGARDEAKGRAAAEALRGEGLDVHHVKLDVGSEADVAALPGWFAQRFGRLDVLVNNAGIALWARDDVAAFRETLDANVQGVVAVTYALLPLLRESPAGRIVNHSSVLGSLTSIGQAPDQFGDFINPVRKLVASRTLTGPLEWQNSLPFRQRRNTKRSPSRLPRTFPKPRWETVRMNCSRAPSSA